MITNYEIGYKDNKEILFIYLDYNTEFAKINSKKTQIKLKHEIKKYIKKNKISFKGTTVAIMVGSLMLGTIMLNKPKEKNINNNIDNNIVAILDENTFTNDDLLYDNYEIKIEEEKNEDDFNLKKEEVNIKEKETINNVVKEVEIKKEEDSDYVEKIEIVDNKTYINLHRSNGNIEKHELEEYVIGVVAGEIPASFNKETIKAQSVLARTYALKSLQTGKILTDNSSTQNYKTLDDMKNMWGISFDTYYNKIVNAVNETKGEYLSYNGNYIEAVYHSTSNGYTEDAINVWGNSFPYLVSVESIFDNTNKKFINETFFTYEEVSNKLNTIITSDSIINILDKTNSGRVKNIEINGVNYKGIDFRNLLNLRSTDFYIEQNIDGLIITTKGYGHGVGMSQYGANGMANNGYNYKDILLHYYKGVSLNKN